MPIAGPDLRDTPQTSKRPEPDARSIDPPRPLGAGAQAPTALAETSDVLLIVNRKSGRGGRHPAVERARTIWNAQEVVLRSQRELTARIKAQPPRLVIVAGGDGTAMSVASCLLGTDIPMGILPMGTFNYFARGLGFDEDPEVAVRQIHDGQVADWRVGTVNGQVFLNNSSIGIYPAILKRRESIYRQFGRRRALAHWSVLRAISTFRRPMRVTVRCGGTEQTLRTPLIFVARSAFQLGRFGLAGGDEIDKAGLAVLLVRGEKRRELMRRVLRLAAGVAQEGVDYDLYGTEALDVELHRASATLVAFDGEKRKMKGPLRFSIAPARLRVVVPSETP